jgi:hypothetical protein
MRTFGWQGVVLFGLECIYQKYGVTLSIGKWGKYLGGVPCRLVWKMLNGWIIWSSHFGFVTLLNESGYVGWIVWV